MGGQRLCGDPQKFMLGVVGIGYEAALDDVGGAGDLGQQRRDEATGAGLGRCDLKGARPAEIDQRVGRSEHRLRENGARHHHFRYLNHASGSKALIGNTPTPNASGGYGNVQTMSPGTPWALCITPGPNQVLYSSDAFPGRIYKLTLEGKVLGMIGGGGRTAKKFGWIHEMACPNENTLYVGELLNWRVQKLTLHPTNQQRAENNR